MMDTNTENRMRNLIGNALTEIEAHRAEWESRYGIYLDCIKNYREKELAVLLSFSRLTLHSSVGRAEKAANKKDNSMELDLRFDGQSIATIKQESGRVTVTAKENISDYFKDCPQFPQNSPLDSEQVQRFISFFESDADEAEVRSEKRQVIDVLLREFRKDGGEDKLLRFIQPVLLNDMFFSMPVPFTVQDSGVHYTTTGKSGHIDILARRLWGKMSHRCIMSVIPDEKNGDYWLVAERALKYAVFMAALFRSENAGLGYDWWNVVRDQDTEDKEVPKQLNIDVVVAVPQELQNVNHFNGEKIPIDALDSTFHFHTLYYMLDDGTLTEFDGSYTNMI